MYVLIVINNRLFYRNFWILFIKKSPLTLKLYFFFAFTLTKVTITVEAIVTQRKFLGGKR